MRSPLRRERFYPVTGKWGVADDVWFPARTCSRGRPPATPLSPSTGTPSTPGRVVHQAKRTEQEPTAVQTWSSVAVPRGRGLGPTATYYVIIGCNGRMIFDGCQGLTRLGFRFGDAHLRPASHW